MGAPVLVSTIAAELSTTFVGKDSEIRELTQLDRAGALSLTFAVDVEESSEPLRAALSSGACVLVPIGTTTDSIAGSLIQVENPRAAFAQVSASHFAPKLTPGISATAAVHPTASVHPTAYIGAFTVIEEGAQIGAHAEVRNHVVIGRNVRVGDSALIKSHAVIGEEGFGIEQDAAGNNFRIPQLGSVVIGDHVEIGGFTTVCSGTISPTVVDDYAKIDDHVHISHNCTIGRNAIITACAEVSGSVVLGERVWLGPNSSVIQGLTIGADALIGIGAVVVKSVPAKEVWAGNPAKVLHRKNQ